MSCDHVNHTHLQYDDDTYPDTDVRWRAIHSRHDVHNGLTHGDDHTKH